MKCAVLHVKKLLEGLAQKVGVSQDRYGFDKMSGELEKAGYRDISVRYLDETLYSKVKKRKPSDSLVLQPHKVDSIAQYLGHQDFASFKAKVDTPIDPIFAGCVGSYYCYVRVNSEDGIILRSPVSIYISNEGLIQWKLTGPSHQYDGDIVYIHHCLFVVMKTSLGKQFHHVYKIGRSIAPRVLQGIFSGVTSAFDPIGGRVLLIKQDAAFEALKERKERSNALAKSKLLEDRRVAQYLSTYSDNNLKPSPSRGFSLDDLGDCD